MGKTLVLAEKPSVGKEITRMMFAMPYAAYLKNRTRISFQPVRPDILNIWRSIPEKQEMY